MHHETLRDKILQNERQRDSIQIYYHKKVMKDNMFQPFVRPDDNRMTVETCCPS